MGSIRIRVLLLMLADFLAVYAALLFTAWFYLAIGIGDYELLTYVQLWPIGLVFIFTGMLFRVYHGNVLYPGLAFNQIEEFRRTTLSLCMTFLLLILYVFLARNIGNYSRFILIFGCVPALVLVPFGRWLVHLALALSRFGTIPAVIFGAGRTGRMVYDELIRSSSLGLTPVAFFDDDESRAEGLEVPLLGKLDEAPKLLPHRHFQYAIFCLPLPLVKVLLGKYSKFFRHILIVPDDKVFPSAWTSLHDLNGFFALELKVALLLAWPRFLKRMLEVFFALFALLTLWPLFLVLALLIKLTSPGPVLFSSIRLGLDGRAIPVLKFRTMYKDANQRLRELIKANPDIKQEWRRNFKLENDPRITKIGLFLRRTSLDELPQFWNVLLGHMSVIGPRPIIRAEVKQYGDYYDIFKRVKPGITGLWQVSGRSATTYERRVHLDMYYIMNWSIWMDLFIFLKTIKEVLLCRGAR